VKKKILITFLCVMALTALGASGASALCLNYNNVNNAEILFTGTGDTITFPSAGAFDFHITSDTGGSGSAIGLVGNIDGTFTIGAISSPLAGLETAPVTGIGTFSIDDGAGFVLSGDLEWVSIFTFGADGGLNAEAAVNVTGITYGGVNADLLAFSAFGSAINALTFQFTPPVSLSALVVDGAINGTSYSGSFCAVPVPPSLILLGSALLGLVGLRRKSA
jgi:hypothetical protein